MCKQNDCKNIQISATCMQEYFMHTQLNSYIDASVGKQGNEIDQFELQGMMDYYNYYLSIYLDWVVASISIGISNTFSQAKE